MVRNGFTHGERFQRLYDFLNEAATARGFKVDARTNIDLMCNASNGKLLSKRPLPRATLFWDKDIRLAYQLENAGSRLFNAARPIELCDDKARTHIALCGAVPMPPTIIAPLAYPNIGYTDESFLTQVADTLHFPMVVKECFGSFGLQVYLVHNMGELIEITHRSTGMPILYQQFVQTSRARDVRVYIVGGKIAAAMLRENTSGDFRANLARGGRSTPYALNDAQANIALTAANLLELDFCGVDLLFGENDEPMLCEVNSNAHFIGLYQSTGVNIAALIMEHIDSNIADWSQISF